MNLDDPRMCDAEEFRRVVDLDESEQRALLGASDPRVRVWAAWSLGLRHGNDFAPTVVDLVASEPVSGVRRHLVVMLAGFGELDIVAALARRDDDERVRATATQYVALLAPGNPELYAVLADCLDDSSVVVRAAAVAFARDDAPRPIRERVDHILSTDAQVLAWLPPRPEDRPAPDAPSARRTGEMVPYLE